jgi:chromosome segregation ATPase
MVFSTKQRKYGTVVSAKCVHIDWATNTKCQQRGFTVNEDFLRQLYNSILDEVDEHLMTLNTQEQRRSSILAEIQTIQKEVDKQRNAIERIQLQYEDGDITKEIWQTRSRTRKRLIDDLTDKINDLTTVLNADTFMSIDQFREKLSMFKNQWLKNSDESFRNQLMKSFVNRLYYDYHNGKGKIKIEFVGVK